MFSKIKNFFRLIYDAGYHTVMDDGIEHAGYLAFLSMLSIFPAMIFLFTIAGELGRQDYGAEFINNLYDIFPANISQALSPIINEVLSGPPPGLLTFAIIGILWTSSSTVEGIRTILNRVYRIKNPPHYFFRRSLSILQFIIFIFLLIIAMSFLTVVPSILTIVENRFPHRYDMSSIVNDVGYYISALMLLMVVAMGYYVLPNIKQSVLRVLPGAAVCVVLWLIITYFFTYYVSYYHQVSNVYGSIAGIIITLIFFYLMSLAYIYGAEFNYLLEKLLGHKIEERE